MLINATVLKRNMGRSLFGILPAGAALAAKDALAKLIRIFQVLDVTAADCEKSLSISCNS